MFWKSCRSIVVVTSEDMSANPSPRSEPKHVRRISCRRPISRTDRSNPSGLIDPRIRTAIEIWLIALPGCTCSKNHSRCCEGLSGILPLLAGAEKIGTDGTLVVLPSQRSCPLSKVRPASSRPVRSSPIRAASADKVGHSKSRLMGSSTRNWSSIRATTCAARSELPPSPKKFA